MKLSGYFPGSLKTVHTKQEQNPGSRLLESILIVLHQQSDLERLIESSLGVDSNHTQLVFGRFQKSYVLR